MSTGETLAGRAYARVYRTNGRQDIHDSLVRAVRSAGGNVLYASSPLRAPVYLGVEGSEDERLGLLCYPFRCTKRLIKNRPADEHRAQIRYGAEETWGGDHALGVDVAGVDVTLVLAVHVEAGIIIGLDPMLYDPLPMGISIEFKDAEVDGVLRQGWHVWERENRPGRRRGKARSLSGLETIVGFRPERLIDYVRFERQATSLGLDSHLRYKAARAAATRLPATTARHALEEAFHLSSTEILEIIANRLRLQVAVKGGVAERHLERALQRDPTVKKVEPVDKDGPPDLEVELADGSAVSVECKNGAARAYANGDGKVEVQKTRSSTREKQSRLYTPDQFDLVAVCLWPESGPPSFRYCRSDVLARDDHYPDRIKAIQRIDDSWASTLEDALAA